jgi:general secretion pathway protein E
MSEKPEISIDSRLGSLLLKSNKINEEDLKKVLVTQEETGKKLGKLLVDLGFSSEQEVAKLLGKQMEVPYVDLDTIKIEPLTDINFSLKYMKQYLFFPFKLEENLVHVAFADPLDLQTIDDIQLATGQQVKVYIACESDIQSSIEQYYGSGATSMERIIEDISGEEGKFLSDISDEDIDQLRDMALEAPVIKLVNLIIARSIEAGASDIHIEAFESDLAVRYRVDGILHEAESPPKRLQPAIISRIKIMAEMNIAERRLPQDGRIRLRVAGKNIDLRVSTIPTMHGESIVMRILDRGSIRLNLEDLGFPSATQHTFEKLIHKPHGIILVTGPTGSGKTTTLYAALDKINSPDKKIITVEDPIEYQLAGINQIQVKPKIGLTFASGLRSIVRQDPDIMMVGEIRDIETAEIAIQSALTGHLVFSTLHTNDAPSAITRLIDMGAERYLISSCLEGVLAQRLVRVICNECKTAIKPEKKVAQMIFKNNQPEEIYRGAGCSACKDTGYRGRLGIYELFIITEEIRSLIVQKIGSHVLRQKAIEDNMTTLREDGWNKVRQGITTVEEVLRVTQEEEVLVT